MSTAAERPPRLVFRFALFTALGLALAAVAIAFLVRAESTAQAQRHAIERARFATEAVLARALRPADLSTRPGEARRKELERLFADSVLLEGILGVALYDESGRLRFATGSVSRGALTDDRLADALRGVATSAIGPSQTVDRVLRTYVPVALEERGAAGIAVFEQDYGPIQAAGRRSSWLAAGVLEGLLVLLFLVLAPVLVRVTGRIRAQIAEIEHALTHDEPTGMANRNRLRRAVEEALASPAPGALLLVDIDGFSELNEVFGSDGGDAVLREVALRLRWELAECDLVARLGEDEFGVVLDAGDAEAIEAAAARIQTTLAAPVVVDTVRVAVTASIGAALLDESARDYVTVIRRAGAALAVAKEARDGQVRIYEPSHDAREQSRAELLTELREALATDELSVYFQPQVDLVTRRVRGVEALLRWEHPERGLLVASAFVPDAERSGLAKELRRFVLDQAARCWREWNELGLQLETSINLGPVDLVDTALPSEVASVIDDHAIPPWNLVFEITERTLVADERRTQEVVEALRDLGVRLAIDDFGVGYSSLASLQRFPVQIVKLDRSLLGGDPSVPPASTILRGSIDLAHAIGATVVAEGVETTEQWELVHALGCDIAQGYLVGKPMPPEEIVRLLQTAPAMTKELAA